MCSERRIEGNVIFELLFGPWNFGNDLGWFETNSPLLCSARRTHHCHWKVDRSRVRCEPCGHLWANSHFLLYSRRQYHHNLEVSCSWFKPGYCRQQWIDTPLLRNPIQQVWDGRIPNSTRSQSHHRRQKRNNTRLMGQKIQQKPN